DQLYLPVELVRDRRRVPDGSLRPDDTIRLFAEQRRVIGDLLRVIVGSTHTLAFGKVLQIVPADAEQIAAWPGNRRRQPGGGQRRTATRRRCCRTQLVP